MLTVDSHVGCVYYICGISAVAFGNLSQVNLEKFYLSPNEFSTTLCGLFSIFTMDFTHNLVNFHSAEFPPSQGA
jgi:hypothetical protein